MNFYAHFLSLCNLLRTKKTQFRFNDDICTLVLSDVGGRFLRNHSKDLTRLLYMVAFYKWQTFVNNPQISQNPTVCKMSNYSDIKVISLSQQFLDMFSWSIFVQFWSYAICNNPQTQFRCNLDDFAPYCIL